jgi:hypothetical protein
VYSLLRILRKKEKNPKGFFGWLLLAAGRIIIISYIVEAPYFEKKMESLWPSPPPPPHL